MEGIYPPTFTHSEPFVTIARAPARQGPNATFGPANQNTWLRVKKKVDENARDADFTRFTQFGGYFCPVIVYVGHDRVQPRKGKAKTRLNQNIREHTLTHTHTTLQHNNGDPSHGFALVQDFDSFVQWACHTSRRTNRLACDVP
jgi:hypothetical protein